MTDTTTCPECGATLPPQSPAGACPRCLMGVGLASGEAGDRPAGRTPPSLEEVAARFPSLELLEVVGQGGMGVVYRARQTALDRVVALKILWPELAGEPAFAERFTREARALAKLDHPNIVRVHEFGSAGDWFYLLMEFVEGASLRTLMNEGEIRPAAALSIVPQICEALQYAHDHGVVHRDIKPANVLLDKAGRVKLVDFGLAKLAVQGGADAQLTQTDQVMGTLHYMAPEQYRSPQDIDHRADIYSLGVVFYEMLTGDLPVGRFEPPSQRVQVDVRLDEIVLRSLEREREKRYQRAGDVGAEVTHVSMHPGARPPARPRSAVAPRRRRSVLPWVVLACVVLLGLPILGAIFLLPSSDMQLPLPTHGDVVEDDATGPTLEARPLHVSGGPAWLTEEAKRKEARRIVAAWEALLRRLRKYPGGTWLHEQGEYVYGPDGMARLRALPAGELERTLAKKGTSFGVPLWRAPLSQPPVTSYRLVAVRFVDGPANAKVAAEAPGHRMWFRMHQHEGSWYFDVAAVWHWELPGETARVDPRSTGLTPTERQAALAEIVALWDRLRAATAHGPLERDAALEFYAPEDREAVQALDPEKLEHLIGEHLAGAPLMRTAQGAPVLADHRVWSVWFPFSDQAVVRAGFHEQWTVSVIAATVRKVDGRWAFTRTVRYSPPRDW